VSFEDKVSKEHLLLVHILHFPPEPGPISGNSALVTSTCFYHAGKEKILLPLLLPSQGFESSDHPNKIPPKFV
jgi:hypothetical protein